jgi:hypothetical protein
MIGVGVMRRVSLLAPARRPRLRRGGPASVEAGPLLAQQQSQQPSEQQSESQQLSSTGIRHLPSSMDVDVVY